MWGLLGHCGLPDLPIGWGQQHGDLPLECGEVNLPPPKLMQVSIRIQEGVPITSFEDRVCGPKIVHHFHQVGLPHCRINKWVMVVLWLEDRWEQPFIVLCPTGQDEVAPRVVGVLSGFIIAELQGGVSYTTMQAHPHWIVAGVKMIQISIPYIAGGVYQAIRGVCGDAHGTPRVANE